jgi:hypothetical protein
MQPPQTQNMLQRKGSGEEAGTQQKPRQFPFFAMFMVVMVVMMVMIVTAFAVVMMAVFVMLVFMFLGDGDFRLHRPGKGLQLRDQGIRIFGGQPQLPGSEGDDRLLHLGMGVKFSFDLGGAVGAIQILKGVCLFRHENTSGNHFDI